MLEVQHTPAHRGQKATLGWRITSQSCRITSEVSQDLVVTRLSPEDLDLATPDRGIALSGRTTNVKLQIDGAPVLPLTLGPFERHEGICRATIVSRSREIDSQIVTQAMRLVTRGLAQTGDSIQSRWRTIRDREQIQAILSALAISETSGFVIYDEPPPAVRHEVRLVSGPRLLAVANSSAWSSSSVWVVYLQGPYSLFRLRLDPCQRNLDGRFELPLEIERTRDRSDRRVEAPPAFRVKFTHPQWRSCVVERTVCDVGYGGLQFFTHPESDLVYPGLEIEDLEVRWKNGRPLRLRGTVKYVSGGGSAPNICGLSIDADDDHRSVWNDEVSGLLHPTTLIGHDDASRQLWDLYDRSGYFALGGKVSTAFKALKGALERSSVKLARAKHLGCQVVRMVGSRVEASLSLLRPWKHAWLVYQLGRRPDNGPLHLSGNRVLLDLYLHGYEHAQRDPDLRWHVMFVRKDTPYSRKVHHDFSAQYADGRMGSIHPFRAMEGQCDLDVPVPTPQGIEIREASSAEIEQALQTIQEKYSVPYLDAYDFTPERFDLRGLAESWSAAGLARERQALVALRKGKPSAVAILDMVEDGVHLVGLLDSVHLVALSPDAVTCFTPLLGAARRWYRHRRKSTFILFEETGNSSYAIQAGLRDLGEADQIFLSADLVPELLENVFVFTSPKPIA